MASDTKPAGRPWTVQELLETAVPEDKAVAVAKMPDEKLVKCYLINGFLAALSGPGSLFWEIQAAVTQEMKRRGLKAKGMMT